jgi:anti-sigma B factor antagonist
MQDFTVNIIGPTGDCAVLQIAGELDAYTAPALRQRMLDLNADGVVHVIADMRQVDFLDSTGLGVLVGGLKRFREHGGSLALVVTKSGVLKVLQVTGLTGVLQARSSVPDAIDADPHWRQAAEGEAGSAVAWCKQHDLA